MGGENFNSISEVLLMGPLPEANRSRKHFVGKRVVSPGAQSPTPALRLAVRCPSYLVQGHLQHDSERQVGMEEGDAVSDPEAVRLPSHRRPALLSQEQPIHGSVRIAGGMKAHLDVGASRDLHFPHPARQRRAQSPVKATCLRNILLNQAQHPVSHKDPPPPAASAPCCQCFPLSETEGTAPLRTAQSSLY